MPYYKLTLGYDGTEFHGSQAQTGRRTVQTELETAIRNVGGGEIRMAFAGRTDTGVHAVGQVASGEIDWHGTTGALRTALNAVGPKDIVISDVSEVPAEFHARFSACWREYRYRIVSADVPPVLNRRYVWWRRDSLHDDLAVAACRMLIGRHSFGTFASSGRSQSRTLEELTRTIIACDWLERSEGLSPFGRYRELRIVADGFLPQMVRNITGAVVAVASEAEPVDWIDTLLRAGDRRAMKEGAPPHGLILWQVGYTEFENGCQA